MKKKFNKLKIILTIIIVFLSLNKIISSNSSDSLKDYYNSFFYIGAAISENIILDNDLNSKDIVVSQFNSITPENSLKWMFIQPTPNSFNFKVADQYVDIGLKNNMHIVGHALIWHAQLAEFMQNIKNKSKFNMYFENHISTVVSRYKGKIDAWDVVNEAFNEDGSFRFSLISRFFSLIKLTFGYDFIT